MQYQAAGSTRGRCLGERETCKCFTAQNRQLELLVRLLGARCCLSEHLHLVSKFREGRGGHATSLSALDARARTHQHLLADLHWARKKEKTIQMRVAPYQNTLSKKGQLSDRQKFVRIKMQMSLNTQRLQVIRVPEDCNPPW